MKTALILVAGLLSVIGTSALAQTGAVGQVKADNAAIRRDTRDVMADRREVHHDNAVIAIAKHDAAHDRYVAHVDMHTARREQRREDALVAHGDFHDARKLELARRQHLADARFAAREARQDRQAVARQRADRAYDRAALADARDQRGVAIAKRDHDVARMR